MYAVVLVATKVSLDMGVGSGKVLVGFFSLVLDRYLPNIGFNRFSLLQRPLLFALVFRDGPCLGMPLVCMGPLCCEPLTFASSVYTG